MARSRTVPSARFVVRHEQASPGQRAAWVRLWARLLAESATTSTGGADTVDAEPTSEVSGVVRGKDEA